MSPRVAHVITDLEIGGAEHMLLKLLRTLDSPAHHLVICMCGRGPLLGEIRALGIEVVALDMPRGRAQVGALVRAARALRAFRPDILQTWMYHADLCGTVLEPWVGHPRLVWNLRCADMELERYRWLTRAVRALLARLSRLPCAVIVNSVAGLSAHEGHGYRPRRWAVIGNGFDLERFKPEPAARENLRRRLGLAPATRLIGMVARRDPAKDHVSLLAAASAVIARATDVVFYLVGPQVETLAGEVEARGLARRVLLEGARDEVASVYAGLDLCVLSSAFGEGFPNVLGEAMACGVPCISTDVGDVRALIAETGLVVPRRAPELLAEALCAALAWSAEERAERGRAARARIAQAFSLAHIADCYAELYSELAAG